MTPEGKVKKTVRELLRRFRHVKIDAPVQNGMGSPMLDFHCCVAGKYLAIETKKAGGVPTPRQQQTIRDIREAGGTVFVIDGGEPGMLELENWLDAHTSRKATGRAAPTQPGTGD